MGDCGEAGRARLVVLMPSGLSKCELAGMEMTDRLVISEEMTSGDAGGIALPWDEARPRSCRDGGAVAGGVWVCVCVSLRRECWRVCRGMGGMAGAVGTSMLAAAGGLDHREPRVVSGSRNGRTGLLRGRLGRVC